MISNAEELKNKHDALNFKNPIITQSSQQQLITRWKQQRQKIHECTARSLLAGYQPSVHAVQYQQTQARLLVNPFLPFLWYRQNTCCALGLHCCFTAAGTSFFVAAVCFASSATCPPNSILLGVNCFSTELIFIRLSLQWRWIIRS